MLRVRGSGFVGHPNIALPHGHATDPNGVVAVRAQALASRVPPENYDISALRLRGGCSSSELEGQSLHGAGD